MNLTTKSVQLGTHTLECSVTREQVEDLINQLGFFHSSSIDNFYIEKKTRIKDNILNNDLIEIIDYNRKYYHIELNLKMWYRVLKISKIYDDKN